MVNTYSRFPYIAYLEVIQLRGVQDAVFILIAEFEYSPQGIRARRLEALKSCLPRDRTRICVEIELTC